MSDSDDLRHFQEFMKRRDAAARAYTNGNPAPLSRLVTNTAAATFFGPKGGHVDGAADVWSTYERDAANFQPGGESELEILQIGASEGVAYWVGIQRATARIRGRVTPTPMQLRVTEIFRREGADWKLVHRHADLLAEAAKPG